LYHKNDNTTEGIKNIAITNFTDFQNHLAMVGCSMCGVLETYRLADSLGQTFTESYAVLNSTTNNNLHIDTTRGRRPTLFKIEGYLNSTTHPDCSFLESNFIDVEVEICGAEVVVSDNEEYSFVKTIGRDVNYWLNNMTSNFYVSQPS